MPDTPLAAAIRLQSSEMMQFLERKGVWISTLEKGHFLSAIRAASNVGDIKSLQRLVGVGGDVTPDDLGHALIALVRGGHRQMVHALLRAGANLDVNGSVLAEALEHRDRGLLDLLIDAGASTVYDQYSRAYRPAILMAVEWGDQEVVERLIAEGVDVNRTYSGSGMTALRTAIDRQDEKLASILLEAGADPDPHNSIEHGPLASAIHQGHLELVQLFLNYGADPGDPEALVAAYAMDSCKIKDKILKRHREVYPWPRKGFGSEVIKTAVLRGDLDSINQLLKDGMDPWTLTGGGSEKISPFGTAIVNNQPNRNNIVAWFLRKDVSRSNEVVMDLGVYHSGAPPRITALTAAVGTNDTSLVKLLVIKGADVNRPAIRRIKRTPIQRAAEMGSYKMVKFLIRLGADVNAVPAYRGGGTALQLAAISGNLRTVKILLDYGAAVDAPPSKVDGLTAIEGAAMYGRLDTVQMLLISRRIQYRGSNVPRFEKAKQYARDNGHFEIMELLEDNEGSIESGRIMDMDSIGCHP
ncbi:hypothetical protein N0V90_002891 [Kalmusia sp. IMI 367209]|nr:hypothetical protein N0V90_002891 [Kalmusia sp. IMI 367209]